MPNVALWVRKGHRESEDAQAFLKAHHYAADAVLDLAVRRPTAAELAALAKAVGGAQFLVDPRHPSAAGLLPAGDDAAAQESILAALVQEPGLLRAPVLVTPRGGLAGFRESKWRAFLDIGRGRS